MRNNEFKLRQREAGNNSLTLDTRRQIKKLLTHGEKFSRRSINSIFGTSYRQLTEIKNDPSL